MCAVRISQSLLGARGNQGRGPRSRAHPDQLLRDSEPGEEDVPGAPCMWPRGLRRRGWQAKIALDVRGDNAQYTFLQRYLTTNHLRARPEAAIVRRLFGDAGDQEKKDQVWKRQAAQAPPLARNRLLP